MAAVQAAAGRAMPWARAGGPATRSMRFAQRVNADSGNP